MSPCGFNTWGQSKNTVNAIGCVTVLSGIFTLTPNIVTEALIRQEMSRGILCRLRRLFIYWIPVFTGMARGTGMAWGTGMVRGTGQLHSKTRN